MPAGTAFVIQTAEELSEGLIMVSLKQTEEVLLQSEATAAADVHQHEALRSLAESLDQGTVDFVGRRYEFHQPLPAGLLAIVLSRCAKVCTDRTSIWRRDLITIMDAGQSGTNASSQAGPLASLPMKELWARARADGVSEDAIAIAQEHDTKAEQMSAIISLIVGALQIEVSIGQQGPSCIVLAARCHAGAHHALCLQKLQLFEAELMAVKMSQWPGCSATVVCISPALGPEGVLLNTCEQALSRGETHVQNVPLAELGVGAGSREVDNGQLAEGIPPHQTFEQGILEPEPEPLQ